MLMNQKLWCLCPKIEYFGISVPFCYYSLLGQVIDFPSRVRVVKKIPSTGWVASTRHSLGGDTADIVNGATKKSYDDDDISILQQKACLWIYLYIGEHFQSTRILIKHWWYKHTNYEMKTTESESEKNNKLEFNNQIIKFWHSRL